MKKLIFPILFFITVTALFVYNGCNKDDIGLGPTSSQNYFTDSIGCEPDTCPITFGQHNPCGNLIVWNDTENVYIRYESCTTMVDLHLWVGNDTTLIPKTNNGTPIPGQFPYKVENLNLNVYQFTIPLEDVIVGTTDFCGVQLYILAHAALINGETAWGGCIGVNIEEPGRWYFYMTHVVCCEGPPPPPPPGGGLQTAFAKVPIAQGGYIFACSNKANPENYPTLCLTRNRWGWAGNLSDGSYTFQLWAGAGLNKTQNGTLCGTVTVVKTGTTVVVTYNMLSGFLLQQVHIYIGDASPPTIAPGQYGHTVFFNPMVSTYTHTFTFVDTNGDGKVWFIGHAVVSIP
ncbi:MAG: hypothetical protein ACRDFC_00670 [Ignavibacteria bacterium]